MEIPKPTDTLQSPEVAGKYTKIERRHFDNILGPDSAVALESMRKITGARLRVSRGSIKHPEVE